MPLGGVGEFGCNCMAVRYGDDMILVDTGMGFPAESAYGVDVEVPDFDFLEEYRENIIAVVLEQHGHLLAFRQDPGEGLERQHQGLEPA